MTPATWNAAGTNIPPRRDRCKRNRDHRHAGSCDGCRFDATRVGFGLLQDSDRLATSDSSPSRLSDEQLLTLGTDRARGQTSVHATDPPGKWTASQTCELQADVTGTSCSHGRAPRADRSLGLLPRLHGSGPRRDRRERVRPRPCRHPGGQTVLPDRHWPGPPRFGPPVAAVRRAPRGAAPDLRATAASAARATPRARRVARRPRRSCAEAGCARRSRILRGELRPCAGCVTRWYKPSYRSS
jgi:hypothetical protein